MKRKIIFSAVFFSLFLLAACAQKAAQESADQQEVTQEDSSVDVAEAASLKKKTAATTKNKTIQKTPAKTAPKTAPKIQTVGITSAGFSPANVTVVAGTTVTFVNKDTVAHWPASGVHPSHLLCPGFDALRLVQPGEKYSFTFKEAKTCPLHDHLNAALKGSITVK